MENFEEHLNSASKIVQTWPEWKQNILGGNSTQVKYVLVYIGELSSDNMQYYFWVDIEKRTDSLDNAKKFTLEQAKEIFSNITVKDDWQIWSIKLGYVLDRYESL